MALSPISQSLVSRPSCRSSSTESVSTPTPAPSDLQGSGQDNLLRRLFATDGFDAPMDTKKAGGVEALAQEFARMAQVLAMSARMLGSEVPQVPAIPNAPVAAPEGVGSAGSSPKSGRTMTFTNDGTSPMTLQFTPNAGEKAIEGLTLAPGKTQTVQFPDGWSGNFRSTSGDGAAATLGEVKFDGSGGQTYYDVSYIEGDNARMTIQPESGGKKSGTQEDLLASAPESIKARDANGNVYGIKKTTTSNVQDPSVVDFYRKHVGADEGYVIPTDDASTLATKDSHLVVHLKNAVSP